MLKTTHKITKKNNEYFLEQTHTAKRKITKENLERDLAEEKKKKDERERNSQ